MALELTYRIFSGVISRARHHSLSLGSNPDRLAHMTCAAGAASDVAAVPSACTLNLPCGARALVPASWCARSGGGGRAPLGTAPRGRCVLPCDASCGCAFTMAKESELGAARSSEIRAARRELAGTVGGLLLSSSKGTGLGVVPVAVCATCLKKASSSSASRS